MQKSTEDIMTSRLILRLIDKEVVSNCLNKNLEGAEHLLQTRIPVAFFDSLSSLQYALRQFE
ncbi:hypothetical protein [Pedobacter sp. Leaf176]|uniref:hypothetical protein n=1 Tax=Pedobacter sp. Leaf176 TaxID=1736286 RepID=UPI0009EA9E73|nr:hypothetical protein [Pedobacter sp. Leaf176]